MDFTASGKETQLCNREELKKLLLDHSILEKIHRGYYRPVIERNEPAREPGGRELIVSYFDDAQYVCTKHRVIVGTMDEIEELHQDVEAAFINGVRYERGE